MKTITIGSFKNANSQGLVKDMQAYADRAFLLDVSAYNATDTDLYLQVHDSAATPDDGAVPKYVRLLEARACRGLTFGFKPGGLFESGLYICVSTTDATKTLAGVNSAIIDANFTNQIKL